MLSLKRKKRTHDQWFAFKQRTRKSHRLAQEARLTCFHAASRRPGWKRCATGCSVRSFDGAIAEGRPHGVAGMTDVRPRFGDV